MNRNPMIRAQSLKLKYTNGPIAPHLLLKDTRLTPLQKLVWLVIRDHEGKNSKAWPSLETISEKVGATRKGVIDAINGRQAGKNRKESDGLTSLGWLTVVKKYAGKARNVANHYECWLPSYAIEEEEAQLSKENNVPSEVYKEQTEVNNVHSVGVQDVPVTNPVNQSNNQSSEPTATASPVAVDNRPAVEVTTPTTAMKDDDRPVSLSEFVAQCEASPRRDIRIVGWWATKAEPPCTTKAQWGVYLRRNLRPAGQLAPFTDDQIRAGYNKMVDAHDEGWLSKPALETVIKFTL